MGNRRLIIKCGLGLLLLFNSTLLAQEIKNYNGFFQLGKYKGEASYTYMVVNNDTILDGDFEFQRTNPKALLEKKDVSFFIKGQFKNNYPSEYWAFRFNTFKTSTKSSFEDNKYVLNVDGEQQVAFGNFKEGYPDGEWIIKNQRIKNSEVENVSFNSTIKFSKGVPQQSFRIEDKQQELVGRFLRNGLAHDKWILFSDNQLEEAEAWFFNEGILQNIEVQKRNGSHQVVLDMDTSAETKMIALGEQYFKILQLLLPAKEERVISRSDIAVLLKKNDRYYRRIDSILSGLSSVRFTPEFKVSVPYYPLNDTQRKMIDSTVFYYQKAKKISDFLSNDTQLNIRKLSDKEVQSLGNVLERINERILEPLGELSDYAERDLLQHVKREKLVQRFWKDGKEEFNDYKAYGVVIDKNIEQAQDIEILQELSKQTFLRLDEIREVFESKVYSETKQQEAVELEEEMILQLDQLKELTRLSQGDTIPKVYADAVEKLKDDAEEMLTAYAKIINVDEKLNTGKTLVNCLKNYVEAGEVVTKLPEQQNYIQQKYTDAVWNPFTATVMDETVKRRILSAYTNVLIPYYLKNITQGLPCENAPQWIELVNKTYDRMLELREEDTRKMERKLKKEEDPLVVLQRFKIEYLLNQK